MQRFLHTYRIELYTLGFVVLVMLSILPFWAENHHTGFDVLFSLSCSTFGMALSIAQSLWKESVVVKKQRSLLARVLYALYLRWWQLLATAILYSVLWVGLWHLAPNW